MATRPRRTGSRICRGLAAAVAAAVAAAATAAAGEFTASAATLARPGHAAPGMAATVIAAGRTSGIRHKRQVLAVPRPAVDIPAIGVSAGLLTLGAPTAVTGGGLFLPVPSLADAAAAAGWYQFTAVPGATGNAVIVGHVDTYAGPAVFYDLYRLRPGDLVYVTEGGPRQRFDVTSVRELPKSVFPVNQVFGATHRHVLWLITCGGDFDDKTGHYLDNIVVSAEWDPVRETKAAGIHEAKPRQIILRTGKQPRAENPPIDKKTLR